MPAIAAKAIVTILPIGDSVYLSTLDGPVAGVQGTSASGTLIGSVYTVSASTGAATKLGATFPANHLPYSLCWAYGRLWCGTGINDTGSTTAGRVYWIRPGIDTDWTLDKTFATSESIVTGLEVFQGKIYASILFAGTGAATGAVYTRTTLGVWSASDTGTINAEAGGSGRGYFDLIVWPKEGGVTQSPTPALYAVRSGIATETGYVIRKFNGTSWSTVYSGGAGGPQLAASYAMNASSQIVPVLMTVGGVTSLLNTVNGTTWTERIAQVTIDAYSVGNLIVQR